MANQTTLKEKILDIQGEVELLKRTLLREPDFNIDERNWQRIKPELIKARKDIFKKFYAKK